MERLWSVWGAWLEADYLALAQPLAHAGSAALYNIGKWSNIKTVSCYVTLHIFPYVGCWTS